jgi:hypothetical protein
LLPAGSLSRQVHELDCSFPTAGELFCGSEADRHESNLVMVMVVVVAVVVVLRSRCTPARPSRLLCSIRPTGVQAIRRGSIQRVDAYSGLCLKPSARSDLNDQVDQLTGCVESR